MIDYQATLNAMNAAKEAGARHFILLSAFCVAKPWLQFQFAKLDFEEKLTAQTDLTYARTPRSPRRPRRRRRCNTQFRSTHPPAPRLTHL